MLPNDTYRQLCADSRRALGYSPARLACFPSWSREVAAKLRELMRADLWPAAPVRTTVESREETGDFVREKIRLEAGPLFSVTAYVLVPRQPAGRRPAVLCLHGHGGYYAGKDMVAGITTGTHPIAVECAEALNYGYGVQLAKEGFITACPDAFNFGERVLERDRWAERHICGDYGPPLALFGCSPLGVTMGSLWLLLNYLLTRPDVDAEALGCVGLSYGAVQTLFFTALEPRIRAAVISGGLSRYDAMLADGTICASQVVPGALEWFDMPDLAISLAPRPVLYEIMRRDGCFDFAQSHAVWQQVAAVYAALKVSDRIALDTPDTDHRYSGVLVPAFFRRFLGKGEAAANGVQSP